MLSGGHSLRNHMRTPFDDKPQNLAAYISLLILIFFVVSAVQVRPKRNNSVFSFIGLGQTCWLPVPVVIVALPQMLLCLWNMQPNLSITFTSR